MCFFRFSAQPEIQAQCNEFAMEAKRLLKADLEHICLENVQACILIGNLCGADADADSESLFFGSFPHFLRIVEPVLIGHSHYSYVFLWLIGSL